MALRIRVLPCLREAPRTYRADRSDVLLASFASIHSRAFRGPPAGVQKSRALHDKRLSDDMPNGVLRFYVSPREVASRVSTNLEILGQTRLTRSEARAARKPGIR